MMIQRLIKAHLVDVRIYHLRMSFSDSGREVGKFQIKKIFHLFYLIVKAIKLKYLFGIKILYYFPAGPNRNPVLRDFFILSIIRPFFRKTILHFRAAGISEYLCRKNWLIQKILSYPYKNPSMAIQLSEFNPPDGKYFQAKRTIIVPNGIEDKFIENKRIDKNLKNQVEILYIGALHRTKGIFNLIEAARKIIELNHDVIFNFVGEFYDSNIEIEFKNRIRENNLHENINLIGVKINEEKWDFFYHADILCFPTYFESESFGNVLIEAMMFELPVISTRWRSIPGIVIENETGLLVNPNDSEDLADKLLILIQDPIRRLHFGKNGRKTYLEKYMLDKHIHLLNKIFLKV